MGLPADSSVNPAMQLDEITPVDLYGSGISYFTGKLEMHFRARGIDYVPRPLTHGRVADAIMAQVGSRQMPADCGAREPLWDFEPLPLDPSLCSGLPFRVDAEMLDVYK